MSVNETGRDSTKIQALRNPSKILTVFKQARLQYNCCLCCKFYNWLQMDLYLVCASPWHDFMSLPCFRSPSGAITSRVARKSSDIRCSDTFTPNYMNRFTASSSSSLFQMSMWVEVGTTMSKSWTPALTLLSAASLELYSVSVISTLYSYSNSLIIFVLV